MKIDFDAGAGVRLSDEERALLVKCVQTCMWEFLAHDEDPYSGEALAIAHLATRLSKSRVVLIPEEGRES